MNVPKIDLSVLSRSAAAAPAEGPQASPPAAVPMPRVRWKTRVLLPLAVLGAAGAMLAYSAREALTPAVKVQVLPVLLRTVDGASNSRTDSPGEGPEAGGGAGAGAGAGAGGGSETASGRPGDARGSGIVQAPGWVEADPYVINVAALAGGVVREVLVLEGEHVEAGQVVARMIDDDARLMLAAAEAELAEREAEVASAEAELEAAKAVWSNPIERHRAVKAAEAMVAEMAAELLMLDPQIATESARLHEVREEYRRLTEMRESRALAEGDLIRWEQRVRAQEGVLEAARARRGVLEAQLARQEAELAAARDGQSLRIEERRALRLAESALVRASASRDRSRVKRDETALLLARMEITSPTSGIVLSRMIEPGTRLMTGDDMTASLALRLYDPARLQVRVDVPLSDAMRVSIGQRAEIVTEAMPDRIFRGRVSRLVHEANIQKNTVQVKVAVEPEGGPQVLKPEMLARVRFIAAASDGQLQRGGTGQTSSDVPGGHVLLIPRVALGEVEGNRARVWIIDELRHAAVVRDVRTGRTSEEWIEVHEGLRPGDRVILDRPANLRSGAKVRVMAEGAGGAGWR